MKLLGFDLRLPIDDATFLQWTPERRAGFLINPAVRWPLSVDPVTWERARSGSGPSPLNLRDRVPNTANPDVARGNALVIIQIDLVDERSREDEASVVPAWWDPQTSADDLNLKHVGFDVADVWLLSGLTNCKLLPTELRMLRERFIRCLNQFGLFSDARDAYDYARAVDLLVSEHCPFYVYRISLLSTSYSELNNGAASALGSP